VFTVLDDIERWIAPKAGRLLADTAAAPRPRVRGGAPAGPAEPIV
jgi:hypothetical protein